MSKLKPKDIVVLFGKCYVWHKIDGNWSLQKLSDEDVKTILEN